MQLKTIIILVGAGLFGVVITSAGFYSKKAVASPVRNIASRRVGTMAAAWFVPPIVIPLVFSAIVFARVLQVLYS